MLFNFYWFAAFPITLFTIFTVLSVSLSYKMLSFPSFAYNRTVMISDIWLSEISLLEIISKDEEL